MSVPLTGVSLLGLAGVTLSAYVIEPAQTAIGPVGTTATNSQVRMRVNVDVGTRRSCCRSPTSSSLHDGAKRKGTLTSIACGASPSMGITAPTSPASSVVGPATTTLGSHADVGVDGPDRADGV